MVFITAGMGGGTGTGAAPVIARMARERGILTVGVVTKPFTFEGSAPRQIAADVGIAELQQFVDTLIVIPNQNLFRLANERTGWKEAFKMADHVLYMGVRRRHRPDGRTLAWSISISPTFAPSWPRWARR